MCFVLLVNVFVRVADSFTLYIDGTRQLSGSGGQVEHHITIPDTTKLLAVAATDHSQADFFILIESLIIGTSVKSNFKKNWTCIGQSYVQQGSDWTGLDYNDSSWVQAGRGRLA